MKYLGAILVAGTIGIMCIVGIRGWIIMNENKQNTSVQPTKAPEKTTYTVLLLGYGGGNHDGAYLTDSMMLVRADLKSKQIHMISLPRDIWIRVPTKSGADFHIKLNALYQLELFPKDFPDVKVPTNSSEKAGTLVKNAVSEITGISIDSLVAVDFQAFVKTIDTIGGIDVNITKSFEDAMYPIDGKEREYCGKEEDFRKIEPFISPPFNEDDRKKLLSEKPELDEFLRYATVSPELAFPCRYEKLKFTAGKTHMDGETALKYARSRHGIEDGGDFGRAARQQQVLLALKEKLFSVSVLPKVLPLVNELKSKVTTDVSTDDIKKMIGEASSAGMYRFRSFVLSDQNYLQNSRSSGGQYILISDDGLDKWTSVQQGITMFINNITPTPSPTIGPSPTHKPTTTISPKKGS